MLINDYFEPKYVLNDKNRTIGIFNRRLCNCLLRAKYTTMQEILEDFLINPEKFKRIRNFGEECFKDLQTVLIHFVYDYEKDFIEPLKTVLTSLQEIKPNELLPSKLTEGTILPNGKIIVNTEYGHKAINKEWLDMFGYPKSTAINLMSKTSDPVINGISKEKARQDFIIYRHRNEIKWINGIPYIPLKLQKGTKK